MHVGILPQPLRREPSLINARIYTGVWFLRGQLLLSIVKQPIRPTGVGQPGQWPHSHYTSWWRRQPKNHECLRLSTTAVNNTLTQAQRWRYDSKLLGEKKNKSLITQFEFLWSVPVITIYIQIISGSTWGLKLSTSNKMFQTHISRGTNQTQP